MEGCAICGDLAVYRIQTQRAHRADVDTRVCKHHAKFILEHISLEEVVEDELGLHVTPLTTEE